MPSIEILITHATSKYFQHLLENYSPRKPKFFQVIKIVF